MAERAISAVLPSRRSPTGFRDRERHLPGVERIVVDALLCAPARAVRSPYIDAGARCRRAPGAWSKEGDDYAILTDIAGAEDHYGDMDFKVAGTRKGITALQMDIKIGGLTREILEQAMEQARRGRLFLLDKMDAELGRPARGAFEVCAAYRDRA